jgi:hypothetical protein
LARDHRRQLKFRSLSNEGERHRLANPKQRQLVMIPRKKGVHAGLGPPSRGYGLVPDDNAVGRDLHHHPVGGVDHVGRPRRRSLLHGGRSVSDEVLVGVAAARREDGEAAQER